MQIEPWHVPVLVMAGIAAPVALYGLIDDRRKKTSDGDIGAGKPPEPPKLRWWDRVDPAVWARARTTALALLSAAILLIFVWMIGAAQADKLATVASAVSAIVGVALTLQSYGDQKARNAEESKKGADAKEK